MVSKEKHHKRPDKQCNKIEQRSPLKLNTRVHHEATVVQSPLFINKLKKTPTRELLDLIKKSSIIQDILKGESFY